MAAAGFRELRTDGQDSLALLVEHQADLYAQLDALSRRQTVLVEAGDAEQVLEVLRERQAVLDELVAVSDRIRPFRERWTDAIAAIPPGDRERIASRVQSIERIAEQINERDERDRHRLAEQRDSVSSELADVGRSRRAVSAYGPMPSHSPRFQDREG